MPTWRTQGPPTGGCRGTYNIGSSGVGSSSSVSSSNSSIRSSSSSIRCIRSSSTCSNTRSIRSSIHSSIRSRSRVFVVVFVGFAVFVVVARQHLFIQQFVLSLFGFFRTNNFVTLLRHLLCWNERMRGNNNNNNKSSSEGGKASAFFRTRKQRKRPMDGEANNKTWKTIPFEQQTNGITLKKKEKQKKIQNPHLHCGSDDLVDLLLGPSPLNEVDVELVQPKVVDVVFERLFKHDRWVGDVVVQVFQHTFQHHRGDVRERDLLVTATATGGIRIVTRPCAVSSGVDHVVATNHRADQTTLLRNCAGHSEPFFVAGNQHDLHRGHRSLLSSGRRCEGTARSLHHSLRPTTNANGETKNKGANATVGETQNSFFQRREKTAEFQKEQRRNESRKKPKQKKTKKTKQKNTQKKTQKHTHKHTQKHTPGIHNPARQDFPSSSRYLTPGT